MLRRVCIEIEGFTKIKISTYFKSKIINLSMINSNYLDLINLKQINFDEALRSKMCGVVSGSGSVESPYNINVLARTKADSLEILGLVCAKDGPQTFKAFIPE